MTALAAERRHAERRPARREGRRSGRKDAIWRNPADILPIVFRPWRIIRPSLTRPRQSAYVDIKLKRRLMKTTIVLILLTLECFWASANYPATIEFVPVGNPGNPADSNHQGAVRYTYRIGKYEVTNAQYAEFLNAVDPTGDNTLGLYNSDMSINANGGIVYNGGAANGSKYEIKTERGGNPVTFVSFLDAMRFTNWLENGQGAGSTESGVYTIGNGVDEVRNPSATYFIPNRDEWVKAASHKNDGPTGNYWSFPTSTNALPFCVQPPGSGAPTQSNTANCFANDDIANGYNDGYAVTGSSSFSETQSYLTDVGAYTTSASPYGTFDQGGNVWEWIENRVDSSREHGGGSWNTSVFAMFSYVGGAQIPTVEVADQGFRIASTSKIPEPPSYLLAAIVAALLAVRRRTAPYRDD